MSNCLLIILVIGLCVTFSGFPCRSSKCCFHSFILSCWFVAFNLAFSVLFLLLTSFIVCQAILDCLFSNESLILSIWFCMYSVCSFRYMLANSFCAFFSFQAFVFVWVLTFLLIQRIQMVLVFVFWNCLLTCPVLNSFEDKIWLSSFRIGILGQWLEWRENISGLFSLNTGFLLSSSRG